MQFSFELFSCVAACLVFAAVATESEDKSEGKHWALLIAGSNGWINYRHQADVCHSYHILKKNGIPDERIVVMMYDDIAYNALNPDNGSIINQPFGPNVYPGVPKDYTGYDVTPEVFLRVLMGDGDGVEKLLGRRGKVIASSSNDRIFVYFADHGAGGILAFPYDVLHAKDLMKTIKLMYKYQHYKQMVFYVEACESGSMFKNLLPDDINVYVTTAANSRESSYACYFDKNLNTFLGDFYSVNWMQDSDMEDLQDETLNQQYEIVKQETTSSHVKEFGNLTMGNLKVADFQGILNKESLYFSSENKRVARPPVTDAVKSEEVPLEILRRRIESSVGAERQRYEAELHTLEKRNDWTVGFFRNVVRETFKTVKYNMYSTLKATDLNFNENTDFTCYQESIRLIQDLCPSMKLTQNDYALRNLRVLANLCDTGKFSNTEIWKAVAKVAAGSEICDPALTK